jgi:hypothetical protein
MASYPDRCQHLKINGTQCGSPALRRNRFCFFHKRFQDERIRLAADRKRRGIATFILPVLEDANSIQMALQQVMRLLVSGDIDHKTASLLLYALQTASSNLRQTKFEASKHNVVLDPREVADTPLDSNIWEDDDFDDEEQEVDDPESVRIEEEAEQAAAAVREKHRKEKLRLQHVKEFVASHPHLKGLERFAESAKSSIQPPSQPPDPTAKPPQAHPAPTSRPAAKLPDPQPAPKKKPYPTQQEFEADVHALTRKHYFPNMPDEIYNAAIKNLEKKGS